MAEPERGARRPDDEVPLPPHRLQVTLMTLAQGVVLHRVHLHRYRADQFNPGVSGNARFSPIQDEHGQPIPTLYGGDYGPDLEFVSRHAGLSADEVVKRHSRPDYPVYMLGFIPGFAYLGGMDESIAAPRLSSPRTHVPKGSVGIANTQTGVYPTVSPGGWQLIGRTPIELYDERKAQPALLQAGDYVHYAPITEEEYLAIQADVDNYVVKTYVKKESELCE